MRALTADERARVPQLLADTWAPWQDAELRTIAVCPPIEGTDLVDAQTFAEYTARSIRQARHVLNTLTARGDLEKVALREQTWAAAGPRYGYRPATTPQERPS